MTYKTFIWDLEMGGSIGRGGIEGDNCIISNSILRKSYKAKALLKFYKLLTLFTSCRIKCSPFDVNFFVKGNIN